MVGQQVGYKICELRLAELNFINHVFPSGACPAFRILGPRMRSEKITAAKQAVP